MKLIRLSILFLGLAWLLFGLFYSYLPPEIPLWYSRPWGVDQLTPRFVIITIPIALTLCFALNIRFASLALRKDSLVTLLILWSQVLISLLGTLTLGNIINLLT